MLGEFNEDNENIDFNLAESNLSKDEENKVSEANDGADDNPPVASDTNNTHKETTQEEVLPPNNYIPVLSRKQKFGSSTDALDESKYVDLLPQRQITYPYTNVKKTIMAKWMTVKNNDSLGANTTPVASILKHIPGPRGAARRFRTTLDAFKLYFTEEMFEKIVTYTNKSIDHFLAEYPVIFTKDNKRTQMRKVGLVDIEAYFVI